jgi:hypothetical protein
MAPIRRACLRLGVAATVSLLLSMTVMMFLVEAPQVSTWFLASASLAALSYGAALIARYFEP